MPSPIKLARAAAIVVALCVPALCVAIPDWVRTASSQSLPTPDSKTKAVILLDDSTVSVAGTGEYVLHHRRVVKILRPEGRQEADLVVGFNGKDKVLSIHGWSIDNTGREYELKDKDFAEVGAFAGFELYNDYRLRAAKAPGAGPGAIVAFESEVRYHPWLNQFTWNFQEELPVHEARLSLQLPSGWEFKPSWASKMSVEPASAAANTWEWTLHDVPGIEPEPMMPPMRALCARMELAYFAPAAPAIGSWDGIGRWYTALTEGRRAAGPEINEKVRQLTGGKTDFDSKLRTLSTFVQTDVRYVAIEIGIGGFQPHTANDTFHARYGDCKDKATLLSSMLHEAGIQSDYVLIHTERGIVDPALPSSIFNHVILAVELPRDLNSSAYPSAVTAKTGKRYIIFDPTDEYTPVGQLRGDLQNTYALLVTASGGELIHTPWLAPETNILNRTGHFTLSPEGALAGDVVEDRTGDHASSERAQLARINEQQRSQHLERRLNRSLQGFSIQSMDIRQLDQAQLDLVLDYKFVTPQYGQVQGPLMLVRPRILGEKSLALEHKPRQYPVEFERSSRETDDYEIELPAGYVVDDLPDPVKVDVGFASYQSKIEANGNKLRYWREFIIRDLQVDIARLNDLQKLEGQIGADENAAVVLKRAPKSATRLERGRRDLQRILTPPLWTATRNVPLTK
jgi:Domain of Unknown Function with PDB structure (DUF3857)/Transglutaminase-like superfamily